MCAVPLILAKRTKTMQIAIARKSVFAGIDLRTILQKKSSIVHVYNTVMATGQVQRRVARIVCSVHHVSRREVW